jgi:hypothetical protein
MKKIFIGSVAFVVLLQTSFAFAQVVVDLDVDTTFGGCVDISTNLRYRSRDATTNGQVSLLQDFFQAQGYLDSEPTGYFGLLTVRAAQNFQRANGLSPTGFVGPLTRAKIKSITCGVVVTPPSACTQDAKLCPDGSYVGRVAPSCEFAQCPVSMSTTPPTSQGAFWVDIKTLEDEDGPIVVPYATAKMMKWTSQGASSCYLTPGKNSDVEKGLSPIGFFNTSNHFVDTTYTITCMNASGATVSDSILIKVSRGSVDLKANNSDGPVTISSGNGVNLSWTSTGATTCTLKPGRYETGQNETNLPGSGSGYTTALSIDTVFTLSCKGYGDDVFSDTVSVVMNPVKVDLKVNNSDGPVTIGMYDPKGALATLTWNTSQATVCYAFETGSETVGWNGVKPVGGMYSTPFFRESITFTLTCNDNLGNRGTDSVAVYTKG